MTFQPVADNLRESFRVVAGGRSEGEIREYPGLSIASANVTFQMFNAAFLSAAVPTEAEFSRRILLAETHFQDRGREWACWMCEDWLDPRVRRRARAIMERHGLRHSTDLPGMVAPELLPPRKPLPELEVRRVADQSTRNAFCDIGSLCFHVPLSWFREVFDNQKVWQDFASYVGYVNGEPVSTAAIVCGAGVNGVYNVATVPGHQRRGYGEAIMRAALAQTPPAPIILQSTPAGLKLYERMGFQTVARVAVYAS